MRIYNLHESIESFVSRDDIQIEIVGEGGFFTATVSSREWSNELQRYTYEELGGCTTPSFLDAYDFIANTIATHTSPRK